MSTRTPSLREGAPAVTVVVRPRAGEGHEPYVVTLHPGGIGEHEWEVYLDNGDLTSRWVGTVGRYEGSLDRRVPNGGRFLRVPGKRRTLWSARGTHEDARSMFGRTSRADAIRWLVGPR